MRIAFVIGSMNAGGAQRITATLANAWADRGEQVHLVTTNQVSADFYPLDKRITRHNLDATNACRKPGAVVLDNARRVKALRRCLSSMRADVVIAMITQSAVLSILATRLTQTRVVASERSYPPMAPLPRSWNWLRRITYPYADHVVLQTSDSFAWLRRTIPRAKAMVIPNPVTYPLVPGSPRIDPYDLLAEETRLLLAAGRLDEGKQFNQLLTAFSRVAIRHPKWSVVILGTGPERQSLERQIARLGLTDRVMLPGTAGNIGDWYARASLYAMTSRYEGFPNTLAEALSYGCPAVSYDCQTGPRDLIIDGENGYLIRSVGDVERFATTLDQLMGDEAERSRLGANAIAVRQRYSLEAVLDLWSQAIRPTGS